ncbi:hypothetical protein [Ureibacillus sp. GCM10028918]|uniref:hypothetical protein n=1 Tax=Ureibacillus sp. GCM10028918 TaxID=3273429 RepID=UPI0036163EFB
MMHVKVKTQDVRLSIPIPYTLLNLVISVISSNLFQQKMSKWTKDHFERKEMEFPFPVIDKKTLKPIIEELKNYKGLVLVDVKAQDGTEVKIRL